MRLVEAGYEFEAICGTSGGAIVASALASGYKPNKELVKMIKETLPGKNKLINYSLKTLFTHWGFDKGDKIESMFERLLVKKMGDVKIPIKVVCYNIDQKKCVVFDSQANAGMSLSKVIRASISIPGIFSPVNINGERIIDGCCGANYYLDIFGEGQNVIGVRFSKSTKPTGIIKSFNNYVSELANLMMESNMREHMDRATFAKTIVIESEYSTVDFTLTDKDVDKMILEGYAAADRFLKKSNNSL